MFIELREILIYPKSCGFWFTALKNPLQSGVRVGKIVQFH